MAFSLSSLTTPRKNPRKKKHKLPKRRKDGRFKKTAGMPKKKRTRKHK